MSDSSNPPTSVVAPSHYQEVVWGEKQVKAQKLKLALLFSPIFLVLGLFILKVLVLYIASAVGSAQFNSGNFAAAAEAAKWQKIANFIEPHKPHYNLGTAYAKLGELDLAKQELEDALWQAPYPDSCYIRLNLATVLEARADKYRTAGDNNLAETDYLAAQSIIKSAELECDELELAKSEAGNSGEESEPTEPTDTPEPTEPTDNPEPTDTPEPTEPTPTPEQPKPTDTPEPTQPTPSPEPSPNPTEQPKPTETPKPGEEEKPDQGEESGPDQNQKPGETEKPGEQGEEGGEEKPGEKGNEGEDPDQNPGTEGEEKGEQPNPTPGDEGEDNGEDPNKTPGNNTPNPSDPNRERGEGELGDKYQGILDRLALKLQELLGIDPDSGGDDDGSESMIENLPELFEGQGDKLKELSERMKSAYQERSDWDAVDRAHEGEFQYNRQPW